MANTISNIAEVGAAIAKASAQMIADKCNFVSSIEKETSIPGSVDGFEKGSTININKPARFVTGTDADITGNIQDIVEETVALTLDTQRVTAVALTSNEIATELALKKWIKRVLDPAVSGMAQEIEADILDGASDAVFNSVGNAGATVYDTDTLLAAGEKLANFSCPMDDKRIALLSPGAMRSAVNARKGLFQDSSEVAKQYRTGAMGKSDGFTFLQNNLLPTHTNGNDVTGVAVESDVLAPATGATTLGVDGLTANTGTVKKGTVFTIAGVNAVHPITKDDLGVLQQFVVTADATANASGQATLSISPAIYSSASDGLQNVSALPADEAAITFVGVASTGYRQSLVYHPSFYRVAFAPLVKPDGVDLVGQETVDGITVRVIRDYDVLTDKMIMRIDTLYGHREVRPEWACRIPA